MIYKWKFIIYFYFSDVLYYKTTCEGYEAKISDCSRLIENGVECKNNGHAYVNCQTIPKFE